MVLCDYQHQDLHIGGRREVVRLETKSYFDGKVMSVTVWETVKVSGGGIVLPGSYEFETGAYVEVIQITSGVAEIDGRAVGRRGEITIEANRKFNFTAHEVVHYQVDYHLR
jgi:uncharacterized protein YaiE (UPF0345 family)